MARFSEATGQVSAALGVASAQGRLLRYLRNHVGEIIDKDQLAGVAGIHEWARRVRELRVEHGWPISSGYTRDDLRVGQYVLETPTPDKALARDWALAKEVRNLRIRGRPTSGKARLLAYVRAVHPRSADKERLRYVAKINEWPRRMRELAEEGWQIVSVYDDPALAPGEYRLASLQRIPARQREAIKRRHVIFDRDGYACADCGRSAKKDRVQLQVHHVVLVSEGGTNHSDNLVTLCVDCHAGRHAIHRDAVRDELLHPKAEPEITARPAVR